jgi:hypothetical protein
VDGRKQKLCEDCADRAREAAEIAEASEGVIQDMGEETRHPDQRGEARGERSQRDDRARDVGFGGGRRVRANWPRTGLATRRAVQQRHVSLNITQYANLAGVALKS